MNSRFPILAATLVAAALPARADEAPPPVTGNVALTSNYKFRGQDQGGNRPAIQGGFDFSYQGFYLGNWNSSINFPATTVELDDGSTQTVSHSAGIEMDFYGGYKGEISGFTYDVGVIEYYYPQKDKWVNFDTTELYVGVGFGPVSAKYSRTVSNKYFGVLEGQDTGYFDISASYEVSPGITLGAHWGTTQFSSDAKHTGGAEDFDDYKAGVTFALPYGFALNAAYAGANKKGFYGDINKGRFIATLSKSL